MTENIPDGDVAKIGYNTFRKDRMNKLRGGCLIYKKPSFSLMVGTLYLY